MAYPKVNKCNKCGNLCHYVENGKHIYTNKDNCCKCQNITDDLFISCGNCVTRSRKKIIPKPKEQKESISIIRAIKGFRARFIRE